MNSTWKAAVGVILIFILGWFGGALTTLVIVRHKMLVLAQTRDPEMLATMLERNTTRNLGLNDDQKKQVHSLLVENLRERMQLQRTVQPQVRAVNAQTLQQIDALLSAEQREKFDDNLLRFKRRFGRNPLNTGAEEAAGGAPVTSATNAEVGGSPPQ